MDLRERPGKVICRDLVCWDQSFGDEVLRPAIEDVVVLGKIGVVIRALSVGEGHQDHVAAFLQRHVFSFAVRVASCVGEM